MALDVYIEWADGKYGGSKSATDWRDAIDVIQTELDAIAQQSKDYEGARLLRVTITDEELAD